MNALALTQRTVHYRDREIMVIEVGYQIFRAVWQDGDELKRTVLTDRPSMARKYAKMLVDNGYASGALLERSA